MLTAVSSSGRTRSYGSPNQIGNNRRAAPASTIVQSQGPVPRLVEGLNATAPDAATSATASWRAREWCGQQYCGDRRSSRSHSRLDRTHDAAARRLVVAHQHEHGKHGPERDDARADQDRLE